MKTFRRRLLFPALALLALGACRQMPPLPAAEPAPWTPAQVQAFRALGFVSTGEDAWSLNLATSLLFDFNAEQLKPAQREQLARVGRALAEVGVRGLRIEGHTDNVGDAEYNRRLSERRAGVVAHVLAGAGLSPEHLPTQGFGSAKPIADNATEAGRAQNRRVVLIAPAF
ncbi:MAG: OmpA family protein [Roseateles sp.]|uniref:OmpA family protein n=1 Tax=Roseateles sp. TaxID=1971397 RepID=UPI0039EC5474